MPTAEPPASRQAAAADLSDRREGDRALRFWRERETHGSRGGINLDIVLPDAWAHCFVLLPKPDIEQSVLLAYGKDFARAFGLPIEAVPPVPIAGRLPRPIMEIFLRGCTDAQQRNAAVRPEGEIEREDGRRELYRAVFIPIHEGDRALRVFGSFNSRLADGAQPGGPATAAPAQPAAPRLWRRLKDGLFPSRS